MNRRALGPGDRYLTATEAGRLFGVSRDRANSAMCVLAERQLLVRHRCRGSFGGPKLKCLTAVGTPNVYVIRHAEYLARFEPIPVDIMLNPLRQTLGTTTNIHFCFMPDGQELSHVDQVIKSAQNSAGQLGVIACSCPRQVYQCLIDSALPTVITGTPYAGQDILPSVDIDHVQGARLLMQYLIRRDHERVAMLILDGCHRPGNDDFLHGLHDVVSEAGRRPNTLRVRTVPSDPVAVAAEVERLMSQPDRPTALIAMWRRVGTIAIDVASKLGLAVPDDLEVVFSHCRSPSDEPVQHTQLRHAISPTEICEQAGAMLDRLWRGVPLEHKRVVVPAVLCERESIGDRTVHERGASSC